MIVTHAQLHLIIIRPGFSGAREYEVPIVVYTHHGLRGGESKRSVELVCVFVGSMFSTSTSLCTINRNLKWIQSVGA